MFKNTLDNKRYHTLNYYYKQKYGSKVLIPYFESRKL